MSQCEHPTSFDIRNAWVRPTGRAWIPVQYAVIDGDAIFEGCVILGSAAQMGKNAEFFRSNPAQLQNPGFDALGSGIKGDVYRWLKRTVPFAIDPALPNPKRVTDAIKHWRDSNTVLRFVERTNEPDWVLFTSGTGCSSYVGRQGGPQKLTLGPNCTAGNAIHEIGHAVGLWHEQSRIDRDQHVEIIWQNIQTNARHNFNQHIDDGIDLGAYDYGSIMHYPRDAFTTDNGKDTIRTKTDGVTIGQRNALSAGDIAAVRDLYKNVAGP